MKTYNEVVMIILDGISQELSRVMWNLNQEEYESPFYNTGNVNGYKNETFEVHAYNWNEDEEQPFNFKYKDIEISWYKHCRRGITINRLLSPEEICEMYEDCIISLRKYEHDLDELIN